MDSEHQTIVDLQISEREKEGIRILDLQGRLVIGPPEALLREVVLAIAKAGEVNAILNFAATHEVDEDGLEAIVLCSARLRESGGALKLVNLSRAHMELIVRVGLDTVFEVFKDEQNAVDSFFPDRASHPFDLLKFVEDLKKHPLPKIWE